MKVFFSCFRIILKSIGYVAFLEKREVGFSIISKFTKRYYMPKIYSRQKTAYEQLKHCFKISCS